MVNNRTAFVSTWLGTIALLFVAGSADYLGSRMETTVEVLTLASAVGTVVTMTFAFRSYWRAGSADSALIVLGLACSPFVVGGLLALNGTEPNFHFTSIGGLLFYGFLAEITAVTLLLSRAFGR
jgi:membrane-associated PAP2 superfamily phosphatase